MDNDSFTCIKCGGNMVKGFAADKSEHYYMKLSWVDGEPQQAKLFGITGDNVNISNETRRTVRGLRCEQCGYLELYAV
jgi:predicted nucleic-acid-binding Zn-ribbon protein